MLVDVLNIEPYICMPDVFFCYTNLFLTLCNLQSINSLITIFSLETFFFTFKVWEKHVFHLLNIYEVIFSL